MRYEVSDAYESLRRDLTAALGLTYDGQEWQWLLDEVRQLREGTKQAGMKGNGDSWLRLAHRRVDEFAQVNRVQMDEEKVESLTVGSLKSRTVYYTGRGTLTIEGDLA